MSIYTGVAPRTLRGNCQRQNYGRRSIHRRRNNNNRRMPDDAVIKIKLIELPARALAAESFEGDDCTAVGVFCALLHIMHCLFCTLSLSLSSPSHFPLIFPVPPFETNIYYTQTYIDVGVHVIWIRAIRFSSLRISGRFSCRASQNLRHSDSCNNFHQIAREMSIKCHINQKKF